MKKVLAGLAGAALLSGAAHATTIEVTVTNTQNPGGLALTPLYFGFHDGSVDLFDVGSAASNGIEVIAETGAFGDLAAERVAQQADSVGGVALGTDIGLAGPIEPGETAIFQVDLDAFANRFLTFASMVVPSNDTFIGVDDPTRFALFDDAGAFLGAQSIAVTGAFAYDAGTEVNDASPTGGAAFVQGRDANAGAVEGGVISAATSLSDFVGLTLANGTILGDDIDFVTDPASFLFAQIEIREVPLPAAVWLMAAGLAGLGASARRRKKTA